MLAPVGMIMHPPTALFERDAGLTITFAWSEMLRPRRLVAADITLRTQQFSAEWLPVRRGLGLSFAAHGRPGVFSSQADRCWL